MDRCRGVSFCFVNAKVAMHPRFIDYNGCYEEKCCYEEKKEENIMMSEKEYENCQKDFFNCEEKCTYYDRCFYRNIF